MPKKVKKIAMDSKHPKPSMYPDCTANLALALAYIYHSIDYKWRELKKKPFRNMNFAMRIKCFTSTPPLLVNKLMDAARYRYNEVQFTTALGIF